jgi:hypothetical protein
LLSSFILKFFRSTSIAYRAAISRSGRRIIQRYNLLSTTFFTAVDHSTEALPEPSESLNSLILKEFLVPLSLEVGRIIRGSETASTLNFKKMKHSGKRPRQALR